MSTDRLHRVPGLLKGQKQLPKRKQHLNWPLGKDGVKKASLNIRRRGKTTTLQCRHGQGNRTLKTKGLAQESRDCGLEKGHATENLIILEGRADWSSVHGEFGIKLSSFCFGERIRNYSTLHRQEIRKKSIKTILSFSKLGNSWDSHFLVPQAASHSYFLSSEPRGSQVSPSPFPGCQEGAAEVARPLAPPQGNHGAEYPQPRQLLGHGYAKPADTGARSSLNGWEALSQQTLETQTPRQLAKQLGSNQAKGQCFSTTQ